MNLGSNDQALSDQEFKSTEEALWKEYRRTPGEATFKPLVEFYIPYILSILTALYS